MRAEAITTGQPYAHVDPDYPQDPVLAIALADPDNGDVLVELHHPDTGSDQQTVPTRTLLGLWSDEPADKRFAAAVAEIRTKGGDTTWAGVQQRRVDLVRRQRALAARLKRVTGIERKPAAYAGTGGEGTNAQDIKLQLNYNELERLISQIENAGVSSTAIDPSAVQVL